MVEIRCRPALVMTSSWRRSSLCCWDIFQVALAVVAVDVEHKQFGLRAGRDCHIVTRTLRHHLAMVPLRRVASRKPRGVAGSLLLGLHGNTCWPLAAIASALLMSCYCCAASGSFQYVGDWTGFYPCAVASNKLHRHLPSPCWFRERQGAAEQHSAGSICFSTGCRRRIRLRLHLVSLGLGCRCLLRPPLAPGTGFANADRRHGFALKVRGIRKQLVLRFGRIAPST